MTEFRSVEEPEVAHGELVAHGGEVEPAEPSRTGTNLACASSTSVSGSEAPTMPQPANSRAVRPLSCAQRSARPHSPSPAASTQPVAPA